MKQDVWKRLGRLGPSMPAWLQRHGDAVGRLAFRLARAAGFGDRESQTAWIAGCLHDVGKALLPFRFWTAPRPLTATERLVVQAHPAVGVAFLEEHGVTDPVLLCAILEHHERMDGSGYPRKLAGPQISPLGRLLAVADAYVAMSEPRPYRAAHSRQEVLAALRAGVAGGPLDAFWLDVLETVVAADGGGLAHAAGAR